MEYRNLATIGFSYLDIYLDGRLYNNITGHWYCIQHKGEQLPYYELQIAMHPRKRLCFLPDYLVAEGFWADAHLIPENHPYYRRILEVGEYNLLTPNQKRLINFVRDYTPEQKWQYWSDYQGQCWSLPYKTKIKFGINHKGYRMVRIYRYSYIWHRLVARAWIPNPDNKPEVDHIDCNKLNNRPSNLRWVTQEENHQYAIENELTIGYSKETLEQIVQEMKEHQLSDRAIAKKYGVSTRLLWLMRAGRRHKDLCQRYGIKPHKYL